ncbi:MAG: hypothetical protein L0271_23640 [Gemmatimonadetes bacterium]|nr:hypothetical protein [Gemmatimonadota bacterium]
MRTRSQLRRRTVFSVLLLLQQLVVFAAVPLADAVLEATARDGPAHFESQSGAPCPPGHDHFDCPFCRVAGSGLLPAAAVAAAPRIAIDRPIAPILIDGYASPHHFFRPFGPRAPPLV